jgi:hypothetical protein
MKLRKSRLNLAVGAVLGAAALIPATSFGWSVDTENGVLSTQSGGDTLLFPLYTTVFPATTSFSTTNTSEGTIVAKIRFREQEKSMDVLDFIVVYSPYDKFDFTVSQGPGDVRPTMSWKDNTCLVGPGLGNTSVQFPAPSQFVSGNEAMSVGHLEVLGMAEVSNVCTLGTQAFLCDDPALPAGAISWAEAAKHDENGEPENCQVFVDWLASQRNVDTLNIAAAATDVPNVLTGRFVVTGVGQGIEAGSDAIGIQDSNLTGDPVVISAQSNSECEANGTANCESFYAWDGREWDHPHLGEMENLENFQLALTAGNVAGDWSNNPANSVGVDWILSFPNKYAYLDYVPAGNCDGGATSGSEWCLLNTPNTGFGLPGAWTEDGDGAPVPDPVPDDYSYGTANLCLPDNQLDAWDREEQKASGNVNVSPGGRDTLDLCQELEIFTLAPEGASVEESVIQTPERRRTITFTNLDSIWGWAKLTLSWPLNVQGVTDQGDAVTGLIFTTRNTDDPTINNASMTDLQKCVGCEDNGG